MAIMRESSQLVLAVLGGLLALLLVYLWRVNQLLLATPPPVAELAGRRWTPDELNKVYSRLKDQPVDYTDKLPPKLPRRYVVTGGSGLVGGYIVLQLLARGNPPESIRILDIRRSERNDMKTGPAAEVEFVETDITSPQSVDAAFSRPWDVSHAGKPLTVFHTAAVILASERSPRQYGFPEAVNVRGTANVLAAARAAGADVFSSTSSGSISIRPVQPFVAPWASSIRGFWQVLDERDFFASPPDGPARDRSDFFGNYPASKAAAERLVCSENDPGAGFLAGCIRPANGVYGNPTDNTVGDPLSRVVLPTWVSHIVQSFVHGANVAIAHLHHEAALLAAGDAVAGRPFVVTDPNPPIAYEDLYGAIRTLSVHPFRTVVVPPVAMLLVAHGLEAYDDLPHHRLLPPRLRQLADLLLPRLRGDVRHLKPGLFSICTHLVASDADARRPVAEGGLGYAGVLTTLEGMVLEILEWNREHETTGGKQQLAGARKVYTTSVSLADQIRKLGSANGGTAS